MVKDYKISEPFFEYGPKCYMYGETLLNMAIGLDKLAEKYDMDMVLDIPDTEIYQKMIAAHKRNIHKQAINLPAPQRTNYGLHRYREDFWYDDGFCF